MRQPLRTHVVNATDAADARIQDVRSPMFRDFWLVSKWDAGAAQFTLDAYRTELDAIAEVTPLAHGVHPPSAGADTVTCALTVDPTAPFDPTPLEVRLYAIGTWDLVRFGWLGAPESWLLERVKTILARYMEPNEALSEQAFGSKLALRLGHQLPASLPALGVATGSGRFEDQGSNVDYHLHGGLELYAWVYLLDNERAAASAAYLGGTLRSIVDEQRRWGGVAADTQFRSAVQLSVERQDGGGFLYQAVLPLEVLFDGAIVTRDPTTPAVGDGGRYARDL